jgi:hypothetical protein
MKKSKFKRKLSVLFPDHMKHAGQGEYIIDKKFRKLFSRRFKDTNTMMISTITRRLSENFNDRASDIEARSRERTEIYDYCVKNKEMILFKML